MGESTDSGAQPTLYLISPASQLCDLQLLLNCSESQISSLQTREDLANSWNVECSNEKHGLCSQTAWFEEQLHYSGWLFSLCVPQFPNLCNGDSHRTYLLGLL